MNYDISGIDLAQSADECYFIVHEMHHGEFTSEDVGKPILAFEKPIGVITIVTEDEVYGAVWTRYHDEWKRHGNFIEI